MHNYRLTLAKPEWHMLQLICLKLNVASPLISGTMYINIILGIELRMHARSRRPSMWLMRIPSRPLMRFFGLGLGLGLGLGSRCGTDLRWDFGVQTHIT